MIVQPVSGPAMVQLAGYPIATGWVLYSLCLYAVAGCCWLPVVWLQLRMRAPGAGSAFPRSWRLLPCTG